MMKTIQAEEDQGGRQKLQEAVLVVCCQGVAIS
jgi:hypothetical protein